jgi:hypothetical protein
MQKTLQYATYYDEVEGESTTPCGWKETPPPPYCSGPYASQGSAPLARAPASATPWGLPKTMRLSPG